MSGNLAVNASLVVSTFILLYGASFTLIMTCWQAFSTAGWPSVLAGVRALRATSFDNPQPYKTVASGLYAGGLAAITVLRDEGVAAVAIGVDAASVLQNMVQPVWTHLDAARVALVPTGAEVPANTRQAAIADTDLPRKLEPYRGKILLIRPDRYVAAAFAPESAPEAAGAVADQIGIDIRPPG